MSSATSNPTPWSARPRPSGASTRRSNARAAGCSPGSSPTRARRPRRAPNTTSTRTSPRPRASTAPGTTARSPPATCSWTRTSACSPTYADPYSSHQRGSNENRNGRIRCHLPKRTSFDDLTDADLQVIVQEINDTPMKVLDWETPNEVWYRELGKVMSKTSHPKTSVALTN